MDLSQFIPVFATGSIVGGAIGAYFQSKFQHQKELKIHQFEVKQKRYLCIILLLLSKLRTEKSGTYEVIRPDLSDLKKLEEEIETEVFNALLFAEEDVIIAINNFRKVPTDQNYHKAAIAMRKDLWGKNCNLNEDSLLLKP